MPPIALCLVLVLALAAPHAARAQSADRTDEALVIATEGFLSAHPDLRHRIAGQKAYSEGDHAGALARFRRAARYGDKPSQGMLGEMIWNGQGTAADRVQGYIWMDLAGERGYPLMLAKRERYWRELDEAERARVLEAGQAFYAEFGDDVARPRLAAVLRRERARSTGSRTGVPGNLRILVNTPAGPQEIDGSRYYDEKYWDAEQYFAWQDRGWVQPAGRVDVGEVISGAAANAEAAPAEAD